MASSGQFGRLVKEAKNWPSGYPKMDFRSTIAEAANAKATAPGGAGLPTIKPIIRSLKRFASPPVDALEPGIVAQSFGRRPARSRAERDCWNSAGFETYSPTFSPTPCQPKPGIVLPASTAEAAEPFNRLAKRRVLTFH
jgi:hypothetical protein